MCIEKKKNRVLIVRKPRRDFKQQTSDFRLPTIKKKKKILESEVRGLKNEV